MFRNLEERECGIGQSLFDGMISVYFFTGIFFTLGFNAFLSQVADDFVTGELSIVGGVISSVVVAWCKNRWSGNVPDDKGKGWLRLPLWFVK